MNGIIGSISLLVHSGVTEEQQEHVDTIRGCSEALLRLVDDILDMAKIDAGKLRFDQRPFRPDKLVREALAVVAPAAMARGLDLRQRLAEDLPQMVVGDAQRLRQVLLNLLSNAVRFTERGYVALDASLAGRSGDLAEMRFSVRDTGIGIPAEMQAAVFSTFHTGRQFDHAALWRNGAGAFDLPQAGCSHGWRAAVGERTAMRQHFQLHGPPADRDGGRISGARDRVLPATFAETIADSGGRR